MRFSRFFVPLVAMLGLVLSGCSQDCPSCAEVRSAPKVQVFEFTLCVSEVPVFADRGGSGCGEVAVEFVAVKR